MNGNYKIQLRALPDGGYMATGVVQARDFRVHACVKVSAVAIQKMLARAMQGWQGRISGDGNDQELGDGNDQELGWSWIKKAFKSAKKIAKRVRRVARSVAQSKVLSKLARTFRSPKFMAAVSIIPGIGPAAAAGLASAGAAWGGLQAMTARRKGNPSRARQISLQSARMAKRYGLSAKRFNRAQRYGAGLSLDPRMLDQILVALQRRMASNARRRQLAY